MVKKLDDNKAKFAEEYYVILRDLVEFIAAHNGPGKHQDLYEDFIALRERLFTIPRQYELWLDNDIIDYTNSIWDQVKHIEDTYNCQQENGISRDEKTSHYRERIKTVGVFVDIEGNGGNNTASEFRKLLRKKLHIIDAEKAREYIFTTAADIAK